MATYKGLVTIEWALKFGAPNQELAREQIEELVNSLLSDARFQEISDESIDIEVREV